MLRPATLLLSLLPLAAAAQTRPDSSRTTTSGQSPMLECATLSGRVTDALASPLTGATIILRTRTGITDAFSTNAEGRYLVTSKKPIPRGSTLLISAAGYSSHEQLLSNCQPLDVTLEPLPGTKFKANGKIKRTSNTGKIR